MDPKKRTEPLPLDFLTKFQTLKWDQKCEEIDSLAILLQSKEITHYDYDSKVFYDFISKGLKDSNLKVISSVFQLLITIIPQLSSDNEFKYDMMSHLPLIVDKFKEKKEKLNTEIIQILTSLLRNDNFYLNDLLNTLRNFPNEKSIQYKQCLSEFIFVNLRKTYKDILIKCCTVAIEIFRNLVTESNIDIRNCAISSLALLKKRLNNEFDDNEETKKIIDKDLLAEIEEVAKNINYDRKYDLNEDEEEIEEEEEEEEEEIEEEEEEEEDIKDNKEIKKKEEKGIKPPIIYEDKKINSKDNQDNMLNPDISLGSGVVETSEIKQPKIVREIREDVQETPKLVQEILKKEQIEEAKENKVTENKEVIFGKNINENSDLPLPKIEKNINDNTELPLPKIQKVITDAPVTHDITKTESIPIKIIKKKSIKKSQNNKKEPMLNEIDLIPLPVSTAVSETDKTNDSSTGIDEFQKRLNEALKKEEEAKLTNPEQSQSTTIQSKKPKKKTEEDEEYSQKAEAILGKSMVDLIESPKWDEKKQGLTLLNEYLKSSKPNQANRETLFYYIKNRINNFKETNFNILKEAYTCFASLFSLQLDKKYVGQVLNGTFEKLADSKLKETINILLITLLDTIGVEPILTQLLTLIEKSAKMQVVKEYAAFIEKTIEDYGHAKVPIKEVVQLCKTMASNSNQQVRTAATSLLCVLYKNIGNDIKVLIKDIKESTLKVIEAEFEKVQVIDTKVIKPKKGDQDKSATSQPKIELIPRTDISKKITPKLLNDINNAKWNEKKEAIETIEKILQEANMKIVNNGLDPLFVTIKAKLADGNKNLVRLIVQLLTKLIQAVESGFRQHTKTVALNLIGNLADKMQILRDDCQICIEEWIKAVGFEPFVIFTPSFLKQDNFDIRNELLKIITKHRDKFNKSFAEGVFKEFIPSFLICLQDKNAIVRNQVEDLIKISLKFISLKSYYREIIEFKPAIAETLKSIINRVANEIGVIDDMQSIVEEKTPVKEKPKVENQKTPNKSTTEVPKVTVTKNSSKKNLTVATSVEKKIIKQKIISNPVSKKATTARSIPIPINDDLACSSVILNNKNHLFEDKRIVVNQGIFLQLYKIKPNIKEKRYEIDKKSKFNFESGLYDYIKSLKDQFKYIFTTEFIMKLFNDDINKNITAIGLIIASLENEESKKKTIENMDLILKNLGWKVNCNQNPSLHKKFFEFCDCLQRIYSDSEIQFNETEINILLNVLVDRVGSTNGTIREAAKNKINDFINIITPQKCFNVFIYIMDFKTNLKIKNEIMEICNSLYSTGEIDSFGNIKTVKAIMKAYSNGDFASKNKLLNLVKEVYTSIGDDIWKYTDMSEKDKDALYDKLDVSDNEDDDESNEEIQDNSNSHDAKRISAELQATNCVQETDIHHDLLGDDSNHACTEEELKLVLASITDSSNNDKVKCMISAHDIIFKNYSINQKILTKSIDSIMITFINVLTSLFKNKQPKDINVKYAKYIVTVLGKIVSLKDLISRTSYKQLKEIIDIVLTSLLVDKLGELGEINEGFIILKSLNSIMLRLIENCPTTDVILVLLKIIKDYRSDERNNKLCELAIKCLLRISQDKDNIYPQLALDRILRAIHELLINYEQTHPDLQIKTTTDQILISYIKNVINDIVIIKKEKIVEDYVMGVESHEISDKYIKRWIRNILSSLSRENQNIGSKAIAINNGEINPNEKVITNIEGKSDHLSSNSITDQITSNLDQPEQKRSLTSQQNEKLNQLKQKLTNLNTKATPKNSQTNNYNTNIETESKHPKIQVDEKSNYKSFNQIQKKWNDVYNRTQGSAMSKIDPKNLNKK